jgi:hypothetical protein
MDAMDPVERLDPLSDRLPQVNQCRLALFLCRHVAHLHINEKALLIDDVQQPQLTQISAVAG